MGTRREEAGDQKVGGWGPEGRRMGTGREDDKGTATLIWCADNPVTRKRTRLNYLPSPSPPPKKPKATSTNKNNLASAKLQSRTTFAPTHLRGVLRYLLEVHTS